MVFSITWKSTALVSGAGLLATWLAAVPAPTTSPAAAPVAIATGSARGSASVDTAIVHEAERLARRAQRLPAYVPTVRNPFRFRAQVSQASVPARSNAAAPEPVVPPLAIPVAPVFHLAGVAMDQVEGREIWTAILSTPKGVELVREGETAGEGFVVGAIGPDRVELRRPDGSSLTLPLSGK